MGEIASSSHRFVTGCTRCLRTALGNLRATDDGNGPVETRRTRQDDERSGPAVTLAGTLLAGSMAVASGSRRLRAALAGIPVTDGDGGADGQRSSEAALKRRVAMASPAVAAGLLAGVFTAGPAQAAPGETVEQALAPQAEGSGAGAGGKVRRTLDVPPAAPATVSVSTPAGAGAGRKARPSDQSVEALADAVSPPERPTGSGEARDRDEQGDRQGDAPDRRAEVVGWGGPAPDRDVRAPDPGPQAPDPGPQAAEPSRRATTPAPAEVAAEVAAVPSVVLSGEPAWLDLVLRAMEAGWDDVSEPEDNGSDAGDDAEASPPEDATPVDHAAAAASAGPGESDDDGGESATSEADESEGCDDVESDGHDDDASDESAEGGDDEASESGESGEGGDESESDEGDESESDEGDESESDEGDEADESDEGDEGDDEPDDGDESDDEPEEDESDDEPEPGDGAEGGGEPAPAPAPAPETDTDETPDSAPAPPAEQAEAADTQWVPQPTMDDLWEQAPEGSWD